MNNLSLKESVQSFIEEINNCVDRYEVEQLRLSENIKIHGLHGRYNSIIEIEKAEKMIDDAVNARLAEFE